MYKLLAHLFESIGEDPLKNTENRENLKNFEIKNKLEVYKICGNGIFSSY